MVSEPPATNGPISRTEYERRPYPLEHPCSLASRERMGEIVSKLASHADLYYNKLKKLCDQDDADNISWSEHNLSRGYANEDSMLSFPPLQVSSYIPLLSWRNFTMTGLNNHKLRVPRAPRGSVLTLIVKELGRLPASHDEYLKTWKKVKSEYVKQYQDAYRELNKDELKQKKAEYDQEYREQNFVHISAQQALYRETKKDIIAEYELHRRLLKKYGLTLDEKQAMFDAQQGLCAICNRDMKMLGNSQVDHNHETGQIRALLCGNCNRALGLIGENLNTAQKIVAYLVSRESGGGI